MLNANNPLETAVNEKGAEQLVLSHELHLLGDHPRIDRIELRVYLKADSTRPTAPNPMGFMLGAAGLFINAIWKCFELCQPTEGKKS